MVHPNLEILLNEAIPGKLSSFSKKLPQNVEIPWKVWESNAGQKWAVFLVSGKNKPVTAMESILLLRKKKYNIKSVFLAPGEKEISAVATNFRREKVPVITLIAEKGTLLIPPNESKDVVKKKIKMSPRVSQRCLREIMASKIENKWLKASLLQLTRKYNQLGKKITDDLEKEILIEFFSTIFKKQGFSHAPKTAIVVLRELEKGSMGGQRDHFFHSFQNFFFGLWVILNAKDKFVHALNKLNWQIEPEFTWFLTALWHDVGYGIQRYADIYENLTGIEADPTIQEEHLKPFLDNEYIKEARIVLPSVVCYLCTISPRTSWLQPGIRHVKSNEEKLIEKAMMEDVFQSHGVVSMFKLYHTLKPYAEKLTNQEDRNLLEQSIFMAAASIPFHDWHFRKCMRAHFGKCKILLETMPFAGLLSFIDSIQDDRRDFDPNVVKAGVLADLSYNPENNTVSASVLESSLEDNDFIWKMIESRDVNATFVASNSSLVFSYPPWMIR